jgi:hypothetical protein
MPVLPFVYRSTSLIRYPGSELDVAPKFVLNIVRVALCELISSWFGLIVPVSQAHARVWQCAAAAVRFDRAVRAMAPSLTPSIIPLLPIISHFAFDFELRNPDLRFAPLTLRVPALTAPFSALLNTRWFQEVTRTVSGPSKLNNAAFS